VRAGPHTHTHRTHTAPPPTTMSDPGPQEGNTSLFAVFALSLLSLVLVPYTISRLAALSAPDDEERPWEAVSGKEG